MTQLVGPRRAERFTFALAALVVACSTGAGLRPNGPCPTYSGGLAAPTSLAGTYTIASYCQGALPPWGPAGTLGISASPDSFRLWIDRGRVSPVVVAGPFTLAQDTISVAQAVAWASFVGTYAFAANTLYVSGTTNGFAFSFIAVK
jgi:hypothetical protein